MRLEDYFNNNPQVILVPVIGLVGVIMLGLAFYFLWLAGLVDLLHGVMWLICGVKTFLLG